MKLSIIILNYKSYGLLANCLKSLFLNEPSFNYEIILVDAESNEQKLFNIKKIIANYKSEDCTYISLKNNLGYARANNLGIKKAKGEYVLILNPDIVIFPKTLDKMINYLDKHSQVAVVGPQVLNPDKSVQNSSFRFPTFFYPLYRRTSLGRTKRGKKWLDWFLMKRTNQESAREVDWLLGACLLVRNKAIKKVGLLDERFFLFLEDTDWCLRFWDNNWKVVYNPDSQIVHYPNRASSETGLLQHLFKKTAWIHLASWFKYYFKNILFNQSYKNKIDKSMYSK